MYVLGIETSCDETAAAVVKDGRIILSNVTSSSLRFHKRYGGVVPEIASRMQLETITDVVDSAAKLAGITLKAVDLISVTNEPGLLGSLLVGTSFAQGVSLAANIPLLGINHVYAHLYANFLNGQNIKLPVVALVVSGGHTSLFYIKDFKKIETLGETQDDACGESFDKVAKVLRLGYPGGPLIERLAKKGDNKKIKFKCSGTKAALNFSFSGIKTAVLYYADKLSGVTNRQTNDICASFQEAVVNALVSKSLLAVKLKKAKRLVVGGGVAANNYLRERFYKEAGLLGIDCYFPPKNLCADNAAMVAGFGYQLFKKNRRSDFSTFPTA